MALNKANITWSCKQIAKMAANGSFTFDNIIQRSYVWEQSRKSNLIHSLIEGYPVPPFYAKRVDGKVYDFLDGKQRIDAIRGYINGEYYLMDVPQITYTNEDGEDVTMWVDGKYFNELPEEVQDTIKDYHLTIFYYENITNEQVRMLFAKLNNGKPLSAKERNIANCVDIESVTNIGTHALFNNVLTEKGLAARKQLPIIMKMWMMLNMDIEDVSFASKDFNEIMQETVMTEAQKSELVAVLDKMLEVYDAVADMDTKAAKVARKKIGTEIHLVSLTPVIKMAMDMDMPTNLIADFLVNAFGNGVVVSDEYNESCKGGSAKSINIRKRNSELFRVWDEFFAVDDGNSEAVWYDDSDRDDYESEDNDDVAELNVVA